MYLPDDESPEFEVVEALRRHDWAKASELLSAIGGADALVDADGDSAMHDAAWRGDAEVVAFLMTRSSIELLGARDSSGYTPLMLACEEGHDEAVAQLLSTGVSAKLQENEDMESPLELAVQSRSVGCVEILTTRSGATARMKEAVALVARLRRQFPEDGSLMRIQAILRR